MTGVHGTSSSIPTYEPTCYANVVGEWKGIKSRVGRVFYGRTKTGAFDWNTDEDPKNGGDDQANPKETRMW